ncbi:MAG: hypothetical protein KBS76_07350 [Ruminococcus sp.]|nr:hypothetical protein [Candidatus Apopatosoma intestinale]
MGMYKQYGHFENNGGTFVITEPETPRHWYNYFFNDETVTFTSQVGFGEGFIQDAMGRRINLLSNRNLFLSEEGGHWSLFGLPMGYGYENYSCAHKNGSSVISLSYRGISSAVRIFVPNEGRHEYWSITLKNEGTDSRTLKLISYVRTEMDDPYKPQGYNLASGGFDTERQAVYGRYFHAFGSDKNRLTFGYMTSSEAVTGFDSRRNAFIGPYGDEQHPVALEKGTGCTGSDCNSEKLCLALENTVTLKAGEEKTVHILVGLAFDPSEMLTPTAEKVGADFAAMEEKYARVLSGVRIETPIEHLNQLYNGWLRYAADLGSRWARVRHNGYRDMTSDTECLAAVNPELAWERMKRVLTYQYENGYAPRTIIDGACRDRNFSDNTVWMTFAVHTIIRELGNPALLNEEVKFNNGTSASVYEHLRRSVDFLWNFQGLYGLVRIWGGDWNDCVNYAGLRGKGVSVWLSIAWVRAAKLFAEIADWLGKTEDAALFRERAATMAERIETYGWSEKDGYYIYARTDDDIVMGSSDCDEGKIFLIPQLWSVFAGLDHAKEAMEKAEELLEIPLGIRLAYPAYSYRHDYIGSMSEKMPGVQDNGGIYLHPSAWKLAVDSILRRPDLVEAGIKKILPSDTEYAEKCGEPYMLYNSYFAPETGYREGTPGQSWRTAATSWMLKSVTEYVFGLHAELSGLRLDPCLPLSWKQSKITKVFRSCTYEITYLYDGTGSDILSIEENGKPVSYPGNVIPPVEGQTLTLTVRLGKQE